MAGTLVTAATVEKYVKLGARFFSVQWTPWLMEGARGYLDAVAASR